MGDFRPEYPGDTPNRKWVRDKISERSDISGIIKVLPSQQIEWIFWRTVKHGYFEISDV